jgi:hypothetical protein
MGGIMAGMQGGSLEVMVGVRRGIMGVHRGTQVKVGGTLVLEALLTGAIHLGRAGTQVRSGRTLPLTGSRIEACTSKAIEWVMEVYVH